MTVLSSGLRKQLESSVLAARRAAEGASRAVVEGLGVFVDRRPEHLDAGQASLRNGLRAKWRQLGGDRELLVAECAYEQWHRLLFARFLAENGLLLHPQYKAPVSLAECEELAAELGEADGWAVAARFAAEILPGIFRLDDPCVRIRLAPEGRQALEEILAGLPAEVFIADDSLGWVYQFWQKDKKDEVNNSERKIGGADLGPVTQLFTENYMVRFLLENSLGAWWAARHPDSSLVKGFEYLRFGEDGSPAAGSFEGWPQRVTEVTVMDPCCGSGHFLVEAFSMLWQMRSEEEGLSPVEAQDAVLRDNLFGLELDPRCVQIAMFAVALQAWKAGGGWRQLPVPNIACSGIPVRAPVEEWKALAMGDHRLQDALVRLHVLFRDADTLGSLIDPRAFSELLDPSGVQASIFDVPWAEVSPLIARAVGREHSDPAGAVLGADVASTAIAADLLSRTYVLVATNVPYLGITNYGDLLREYIERRFGPTRHELGYSMTARWLFSPASHSTIAVVCPSDWLDAPSVEETRRSWLSAGGVSVVARLGYKSFLTKLRVNPSLLIASPKNGEDLFCLIDIRDAKSSTETASKLRVEPIAMLGALRQLAHSRSVVTTISLDSDMSTISDVALCKYGLSAGDSNRFERNFWEVVLPAAEWEYLQTSSSESGLAQGRELVVLWEGEQGSMAALAESVRHLNHKAQQWRSGKPVWGRRGVAINRMASLRASLYVGDRFSERVMAVVPRDQELVVALWCFAESGELERLARTIARNLSVSPSSIGQVPFDTDYWQRVAAERFPDGLPDLWSDNPTQWLFRGQPQISTSPLQVAVARLVGYRWPEQGPVDELDGLADADGIVCVPSVAGEAPAADRVQQLLAEAYGERWSPSMVAGLLAEAGSKKKNLVDWLRDEYFKEHCTLFQNRPFVWHIWDGLRDGFSALVNYHRLDHKILEKLTYTYLGTYWVERQRAELRDEVAGAEARLAAALELQRKLALILEGEPPFDIYARWKSVAEQPIGWNPDLNDGVRLNIRPFVEAGVLRSPVSVHWRKDPGKNTDGTERHNDIHLTLADKTNARAGTART